LFVLLPRVVAAAREELVKLFSATGHTVRNAVRAAKDLLGRPELRIASDVDHGDGLHRVTLTSGDVVEVTVRRGACSSAEEL
jgi:hypothetical protein